MRTYAGLITEVNDWESKRASAKRQNCPLTTERKGSEVNRADRHCVVHFMTIWGVKGEKQWVPLPGKSWVRDPKVAIGQELRYQLQETASEESESEWHARKIEGRY